MIWELGKWRLKLERVEESKNALEPLEDHVEAALEWSERAVKVAELIGDKSGISYQRGMRAGIREIHTYMTAQGEQK